MNYFTTPSAQTQLAAAGGRAPANLKAKATDPILAQFGKASKGGVPMPNIPQMSQCLERSRPGVGPLDEGRRRNAGRALLQGRCSRDLVQDRLARTFTSGAGAWRRPLRTSAPPGPVSTATTPTTPAAPPPFRPGLIARGIAFFSGSVGFAIKIALLCASNALAVWAIYVLITHSRWPAVVVLIVGDASDRPGVPRAAPQDAAVEVPDPGHGLPDRVPDHPDPLHDQRRLLELLDRPHPHAGPGDRRDQDQLARTAGERPPVRPRACARLVREPRADHARRDGRQGVRRHDRRG